MELSKYIYCFSNENRYFVFNIQNRCFLELSYELYNLLNNRDVGAISLLSSKAKKTLSENGIIGDSGFNDLYIKRSKLKYLAQSFDNEYLSLVILPTLECNFDCFYCFEGNNKISGKLDDSVCSNIIEFIKRHKGVNKLDITWYGGEPLLEFESIKKIWKRIKEEVNLPIESHTMMTNGYLINDSVLDFFNYSNMKSIQITLDGDKDSHDKLRCLKKESIHTFDTILNNIQSVIEKCPSVNVSVRVNLNNDNRIDFENVYLKLEQFNSDGRIHIYPAFLHYDKNAKCSECSFMNSRDIRDFYLDLKNVDVNYYPQYTHTYCSANCWNSYLIAPNGDLYKCFSDVGNIKRKIGDVKSGNLTNENILLEYILDSSCFEDKQCVNCKSLPLCGGGCSYLRLQNKYEGTKHSICTLYKDDAFLKEVLMKYYKQKIEGLKLSSNSIIVK